MAKKPKGGCGSSDAWRVLALLNRGLGRQWEVPGHRVGELRISFVSLYE